MNQISQDPAAARIARRPRLADTPLLVIGAGPYGLATAAAAMAAGIQPLVVGELMGFWRRNMPAGMLLRSSVDWHLDSEGDHTLAAYLEDKGVAASDVDPIPLELFIDYAEWFRSAKHIPVDRCASKTCTASAPSSKRRSRTATDCAPMPSSWLPASSLSPAYRHGSSRCHRNASHTPAS